MGNNKTKNIIFSILLSIMLCASLPLSGLAEVTWLDDSYVASAAQLSTPSISAKASGYEGISISWKSISGAKTYQIYRATTKTGTYKKVATTKKRTYLDKKIDQNKYYCYKVRAVSGSTKSTYSTVKSARVNTKVSLSSIKAYSGSPYVKVNNNIPKF